MPGFVTNVVTGQPPQGRLCLVCNLPLQDGQQAALCSEDQGVHHAECWEWNGYHCANPNCTGTGALVAPPAGWIFGGSVAPIQPPPQPPPAVVAQADKPARSLQTVLLLGAIPVVILALGLLVGLANGGGLQTPTNTATPIVTTTRFIVALATDETHTATTTLLAATKTIPTVTETLVDPAIAAGTATAAAAVASQTANANASQTVAALVPPPTDTPTSTSTTTALPIDTLSPTIPATPPATRTSTPTRALDYWEVEYYADGDLTRQCGEEFYDPLSIDRDWGSDAPAIGCPADDFSARFTRSIGFAAGTYEFYVDHDDGVRLYIDGELVLDNWSSSGIESSTVALSARAHDIRVELVEFDRAAHLRVDWVSMDESIPTSTAIPTETPIAGFPLFVTTDSAGNDDPALLDSDGTLYPFLTLSSDDYLERMGPDSRLVFTRVFADKQEQLFITDDTWSEVTQLTSQGTVNRAAVWAPGGNLLAFESNRDGLGKAGARDIYTMNPDGSDVRRVTDAPGWQGGPAWSPDGQEIVYHSLTATNYELDATNLETGQTRRIIAMTGQDLYWPDWSPDGKTIAFMSENSSHDQAQLYTVPLDDGVPVPLQVGAGMNRWPRWSPDGQALAFESNRDGKWQIYLLTLADGQVRRISKGDFNFRWPDW